MAHDSGSGGRVDRVRDTLQAAPVVVLAGALVGIAQLPESARRGLSFEYGDPTILTAYTAPFVHFSPSHLLGNVAVLLLAGFALSHLSRRARSPWLFLGALTVVISTLPAAVTLLNLAVPRPGVTYGFSGVNMALVGFLPIAVVRYAEWRLGRRIDAALLIAWFAASTGYVAAVAVPPSPITAGVIGMSLAVVVAVVARALALGVPGSVPFSRLASDPSVVAGVGVWLALLVVGFPRVSVVDGTVTNVYVHFLGYALGFTTAYLAHELEFVGARREWR